MTCPICGKNSIELYSLSKEKIISSLESHFREKVSSEVEIIENYFVNKCQNCDFEFVTPQIEGSNTFYQWVTSQKTYYPEFRWEYQEVIEIIKNNNYSSLVDIGCGDGMFLDALKAQNFNNFSYCGIDTTAESINICNKKGLESYNLEMSEFQKIYPNRKFDLIVSFHCLEHIGNVNKFISEMKLLLNEKGSIFISTPYSPMTIEFGWFDILNNPPHHMGRWNLKAYNELAKVNDLEINFHFPPAPTFVSNAIQSFLMSEYNSAFYLIKKTKIELIKKIILKPLKFFKHLYFQSKRDKFDNKIIPNVILVELKNRH